MKKASKKPTKKPAPKSKPAPKPKRASHAPSLYDLFRMMEQQFRNEFDGCSVQVAIQAAVNAVCDVVCEEKTSDRSSMLVARFCAASQRAFTLANEGKEPTVSSIRVDSIPVLDLLESIQQLVGRGLRLDLPVDPSEVRLIFDANGIPAKPIHWIQIAKQIESSVAALPATGDAKQKEAVMRQAIDFWNSSLDVKWKDVRDMFYSADSVDAVRNRMRTYCEDHAIDLVKKSPGQKTKRKK